MCQEGGPRRRLRAHWPWPTDLFTTIGPRGLIAPRAAWIAVTLATVFALSDEIHQRLHPGRSAAAVRRADRRGPAPSWGVGLRLPPPVALVRTAGAPPLRKRRPRLALTVGRPVPASAPEVLLKAVGRSGRPDADLTILRGASVLVRSAPSSSPSHARPRCPRRGRPPGRPLRALASRLPQRGARPRPRPCCGAAAADAIGGGGGGQGEVDGVVTAPLNKEIVARRRISVAPVIPRCWRRPRATPRRGR
jgi:hypothetical protein